MAASMAAAVAAVHHEPPPEVSAWRHDGGSSGRDVRLHTGRTEVLYAHRFALDERKLVLREDAEAAAATFRPTLHSTSRAAQELREVAEGGLATLIAGADRKAREKREVNGHRKQTESSAA
jgi:hypothetical protein